MTDPAGAPPCRALLWDNDGVLVDTERWYFAATREVLATVGVELTAALFCEHFLVRAEGAWHLAAARGCDDRAIEELRRRRNARYLALLEREPVAVPGVREALAALRPHFTMGIVTSSRRDHFAAIHARTGLLPFFDFVLTREDYARSKLDPEPYRLAVARTGRPAAACLAIEDTPRGLAAAHAAGVACWVVPNALGPRDGFAGAQRVLADVPAVARMLLADRQAAPA